MTTNDVIERDEQTMEGAHLDVVAVKATPLPTVTPEMFDALERMPEGFSLQQAYLVFDAPGKSYRLLYVGLGEMYSPEQAKAIPTAMFMWRNPETRAIQRVIHAGDNLVKQLQNCPIMPNGTPVKVTFVGKEKANSGRFFNKFDVVVLNSSAAPLAQHDAPAATAAQVTPEEVIGYINAIKPTDDKNAVKAQIKAYAKALDINLGSPANLSEAIRALQAEVAKMVTAEIAF